MKDIRKKIFRRIVLKILLKNGYVGLNAQIALQEIEEELLEAEEGATNQISEDSFLKAQVKSIQKQVDLYITPALNHLFLELPIYTGDLVTLSILILVLLEAFTAVFVSIILELPLYFQCPNKYLTH